MSNNLIDHVDRVMAGIKEDDRQNLLVSVVYEAGKFWLRAGCLYDFCIQNLGETCIIFGGTNRVIWNPYGFSIDESYCSENFLKMNAGYRKAGR